MTSDSRLLTFDVMEVKMLRWLETIALLFISSFKGCSVIVNANRQEIPEDALEKNEPRK